MDINDTTRRPESNPVAEILEIVRRRVLKERMAEDERDGCVLIDWLDGSDEPEPGA
ncbi:MAG: hypothetical protein OXH87_00740 [Rhodospirillaceae bacterium]|nr:hypothetical protein [Defluviicoccus sp.]MDE0616095.1 hypothetical protein [Rhodospirillaceae bacterium]